MKFILATHNRHKVFEFSRILSPLGIEIISQLDAGIEAIAVEDGKTFSENAEKKALTVREKADEVIIADDSGICIDAFNGAPGILSSRFLGEDTPYDIKNKIILDRLCDVKDEDRTARYVCSICCVFPNSDKIVSEGICEGKIGYEPHGENGFGYDPIFYIGEKSMAEISDVEKDRISHRGIALRDFAKKLEKYLNKQGEKMLTSKQRAALRGCANEIDTILQVGKGGVVETLVKQADDALTARELIKIKVLKNCEYSAREICEVLSKKVLAEPVQVIGSKIVLFRRNSKKTGFDNVLK